MLTCLYVNKDFDHSGNNQLVALFITEAKKESLAKKAKARLWSLMKRKKTNYPTKCSIIFTSLSIDNNSLQTGMMTKSILQSKMVLSNFYRTNLASAVVVILEILGT